MRTPLLFLIAVSGCKFTAFITEPELNEKKALIDSDGDLVPDWLDCSPGDARRRPGTLDDVDTPKAPTTPQTWEDPTWAEIPYDGIDNDCTSPDNYDLIDIDGDSYPGVDKTTYQQQLVNEGLYDSIEDVPWDPLVLDATVDCNDENADIYPGASDPPYDGIDANCDLENDFDFDEDGQMPSKTMYEYNAEDGPQLVVITPEDVSAFAASIGTTIDVTGANAFGDCDDNEFHVKSQNAEDVPYDGVDFDCDGANDFDQDQDDYRPSNLDDRYDQFLIARWPDPNDLPAWAAVNQAGDCMDAFNTDHLMGVDPATVYPGAPETPYDGVDSDCAGDTDFDADDDGYHAQDMDAEIQAYIDLWTTGRGEGLQSTFSQLLENAGDCDDNDPIVAPGNLELLGDAADADCDGNPDGTPFFYHTLAWEEPTWPRILRNDQHYLVLSNAAWAVRRNASLDTELPNAAPLLYFDAHDPLQMPGYQARPEGVTLWQNTNFSNTMPLSGSLDAAAPGLRVYIANSQQSSSLLRSTLVQRGYAPLQDYEDNVALSTRSITFTGFDADADVTFIKDSDASEPHEGWLWSTSCGGHARLGRLDQAGDYDQAMAGTVRQSVMRTPYTAQVVTQHMPIDPTAINTPSLTTLPEGQTADVCWHVPNAVDSQNLTSDIFVCDVDGCIQYESTVIADTDVWENADFTVTFDEIGPNTEYGDRGLIEADTHEDLLVLVQADGVELEELGGPNSWSLFTDEPVISADAMRSEGNLYAVAVIAGDPNELWLTYGDETDLAHMTTRRLEVDDSDEIYMGGVDCIEGTPSTCQTGRTLDPQRVSLHADADRVAIAIAAWTPEGYQTVEPDVLPIGRTNPPQDGVGWIFMQPAPPVPVP